MYSARVQYKHKSKFGRTTEGVGTQADRQEFSQVFHILPNFHKCFYNSLETQTTCILFLLEN